MYDTALGRWHAADPHAEDYTNVSPYCYALNNPVLFVDPDGMDVINADEERLKKAEDIKVPRRNSKQDIYKEMRVKVVPATHIFFTTKVKVETSRHIFFCKCHYFSQP